MRIWLAVVTLVVLVPGLIGELRAEEEAAAPTVEEKVRALLKEGGRKTPLDEAVEAVRKLRELLPFAADEFEAALESGELVDLLVPIFVKHLDEEALDALLAFNESPEGRRVNEALPRIQADAELAVKEWGKVILDRVRKEAARKLMPEPGLVLGEDLFERDWFGKDLGLGTVTHVCRADLHPRPGLEIAIAGTQGALLADDETRLIIVSLVHFTPLARGVLVVDADADGQCEYCERHGGIDRLGTRRVFTERRWQAVDLLDHEGHLRWSYGGDDLALSMTAGNLDDDPEAEFVVGFEGTGGLHFVDHEGSLIRRVPAEGVGQIELADLDGDGRPEIVHTDAQARLTIRTREGELIRRLTLHEPVKGFSVCRWPTAKSPARLLVWSSKRAPRLLDLRGEAVHVFELPEGPSLAGAWGIPFVPSAGKARYFALLVHYEATDLSQLLLRRGPRGALFVFGADNRLVYHEVFEAMGSALATIPGEEPGEELLLVPYEDALYEFSARLEEEIHEEKSGFHPEVRWSKANRSRARVTLDWATWEYFRDLEPSEIVDRVSTQQARDENGIVLGLQITGFDPETPFAGLGLNPGDIVSSIDDTPIKTRKDALKALAGRSPDATLLRLVIDRRGRLITFEIDVRGPAATDAAESNSR